MRNGIYYNNHRTQTQVFDYRVDCDRNGYFVVAIKDGLKFPTLKQWPTHATARYWIRNYPSAHYLGTGILCAGLRLIDVDIEDKNKVETIRDYLESNHGKAPTRYRDNSNRITLMYRATHGEEPRKSVARNRATKEAVEILGAGSQCFVDGMHPSGYPLLWRQGCPQTVHRDQLGILTDDDTKALLTFVGQLICADNVTIRRNDDPMPVLTRTGDEWCIADIINILDNIPNHALDWDYWFSIGAAVFVETNGSIEGFNAFLNWSRQCDGSDDADAKCLWRGFFTNTPFRITGGTLYHHARQNNPDWDKPSNGLIKLNIFRK